MVNLNCLTFVTRYYRKLTKLPSNLDWFFLNFVFNYDLILFLLFIWCWIFMSIVHPVINVRNQLVGSPFEKDVTIECNVEASPKSINYWIKDVKDGKFLHCLSSFIVYSVVHPIKCRNCFHDDKMEHELGIFILFSPAVSA